MMHKSLVNVRLVRYENLRKIHSFVGSYRVFLLMIFFVHDFSLAKNPELYFSDCEWIGADPACTLTEHVRKKLRESTTALEVCNLGKTRKPLNLIKGPMRSLNSK